MSDDSVLFAFNLFQFLFSSSEKCKILWLIRLYRVSLTFFASQDSALLNFPIESYAIPGYEINFFTPISWNKHEILPIQKTSYCVKKGLCRLTRKRCPFNIAASLCCEHVHLCVLTVQVTQCCLYALIRMQIINKRSWRHNCKEIVTMRTFSAGMNVFVGGVPWRRSFVFTSNLIILHDSEFIVFVSSASDDRNEKLKKLKKHWSRSIVDETDCHSGNFYSNSFPLDAKRALLLKPVTPKCENSNAHWSIATENLTLLACAYNQTLSSSFNVDPIIPAINLEFQEVLSVSMIELFSLIQDSSKFVYYENLLKFWETRLHSYLPRMLPFDSSVTLGHCNLMFTNVWLRFSDFVLVRNLPLRNYFA